jgi:hypothetical protein
MTARRKKQPLVWEPPGSDVVRAAFEKAFAARPEDITLTIRLMSNQRAIVLE